MDILQWLVQLAMVKPIINLQTGLLQDSVKEPLCLPTRLLAVFEELLVDAEVGIREAAVLAANPWGQLNTVAMTSLNVQEEQVGGFGPPCTKQVSSVSVSEDALPCLLARSDQQSCHSCPRKTSGAKM